MFTIFTLMAMPPWGLLASVNLALGLVGLAVQIIGLFGLFWVMNQSLN